MIAIYLSILFFILGVKRSIPFGLLLIICVPFSGTYYEYINIGGIFVYDLFFAGLALRFLATWEGKINKNINLLPAVIIILYSLIALTVNSIDSAFLRDFRPAILILEAFLLFNFIQKTSQKKILNILIISFIISLIFGTIGIMFFYDEAETRSFNYSSLSTYVAVIIFLLRTQLKDNIDYSLSKKLFLLIFLSCLLILMSWNRTIIIGIIIFEFLKSFKRIKKFIPTIFGLTSVVFLVLFIAEEIGINKITQNLSIERIITQLNTRYGPALPFLSDIDSMEFFLGNGFGTLFYIPWFEFWGNESFFNFIDNTFLTFFIKYGIIGLIITAIIIFDISKIAQNRLLIIFFLILFMTVSFPYQMSAIGIYIGLYLVREINNKKLAIES